MNVSMYHVLLRVSALTIALVLVFDSGILSPITRQLSYNTQQYLGQAVGVKAQVKPTEINKLSAQIAQRNSELDKREAALSEREIAVGLQSPIEKYKSSNLSTYILSIILFILVVLIVLNYALDFARERQLLRKNKHEQTA